MSVINGRRFFGLVGAGALAAGSMAVLLSFFRHRHTVETGQKSSVMLEEGLAAARSGFEKAFEQLRKLSGILRKKEEV